MNSRTRAGSRNQIRVGAIKNHRAQLDARPLEGAQLDCDRTSHALLGAEGDRDPLAGEQLLPEREHRTSSKRDYPILFVGVEKEKGEMGGR